MHSISKNLKKIRMDRGWTQQQMADVLFVTRQTVSNWENGKSMPDLNMLTDIAEKLNVDVNVLLYGPQKKDVRLKKDITISILLVMFAAISEWLLVPYISKICNITFCMFDTYLSNLIILPIFSFTVVRLAFQTAKAVSILPATISIKYSKAIRKVIQTVLIVYTLLIVPSVMYEFVFFMVSWSGSVLGNSRNNSSVFLVLSNLLNFMKPVIQTMFKIPVYSKLTQAVIIFICNKKFTSMCFIFIMGRIYELTKPVNTKTSSSVNEKSGTL